MKRALYAGTFDPPTKGHLDIIRRAALLFPSLIVGVATNAEKKFFWSKEERFQRLTAATKDLPKVQIVAYDGLTWEFARKHQVDVLIRSLRPGEELAMEFSLAAANKELGGIETLFMAADPKIAFISSSLVREILSAGGDASKYLA